MSTHSPQKILIIVPHPDDETMIRSLISRLVENGNLVSAIYLTQGEGGSDHRWANPHPTHPLSETERLARQALLARTRTAEMAEAAEKYQYDHYYQLDFPDDPLRDPVTGIPSRNAQRFLEAGSPWDLKALKSKLYDLATKVDPDLIVTFFPGQPDSHAHHQAISKLVTELYDEKSLGTHAQALYGFYEFHVVEGIERKIYPNTIQATRLEFAPTLKSTAPNHAGKAYGELGTTGALAHESQNTGVTGEFFKNWDKNPNEILAPIRSGSGTTLLEKAIGILPGVRVFKEGKPVSFCSSLMSGLL